ncbi:cytochrome P450 [Actinomadura verrucosospora]|uniref:Cytochrome P450 n=1 Tax=Actinomadura verrucosospora TaxID=46165 RepID=A0A7D3VV00_ACTVE|nr:cytochrome P450 [Actinomadura verrucosospora]QKG23250.1 hypothetical protein ACTIVE_4893 [Actinomadura verrucosospora]
MPASEARVPTDRADRYLKQLCKHADQVSALAPRHGHDLVRRTEGVIEFDGGRCTLRADGEALTLRAEAADRPSLDRLQDAIAGRLRRIGRRDALAVTWTPAGTGPDGAAAIVGALLTPDGRADPFPLYARAHALGPVSEIADGRFLVCGHAAVDRVLRDPGFGPAARPPKDPGGAAGGSPSMARSILWAGPPDHGRMRSLISQVFTARRVAALRPAIEDAADALLDGLAESGADGRPADFMDRFAFPLPVTVIGELLGVPAADRHRFRRPAADLTEALELPALASPPGAVHADGPAGAAARELAGYFTRLIRERRAAPRDDLVGALVAARDAGDGRLSDEELLANLVLLLVAGFETTAGLLGNGLAILLDRPDVRAGLRSGEIEVPGFVEEVLRYDSPVQITTRVARTGGLTVGGLPVPEGGEVVLLIGAANRDPARYRDPDRFDPSRRDVKPLSFGAGPHICLGNGLARLEAAVALPRLLARFPEISAVPGAPRTRRDRLVLRGHETFPVRLVPSPSPDDDG